jgi:hypothetical protein
MNTIQGQALVAVSKEVAEAAKELENIRGILSQMNSRAEELRKLILDNVEIGHEGFYQGHKVVAVNSRKSSKFDKKGVEKSHPELVALFEEFTSTSISAVVETF